MLSNNCSDFAASFQGILTMMKFFKFIMILLLFIAYQADAQKPVVYNTAEIRQMLKKLNVLGTVLYVAAHPDDENTRMIGYFANEEMYRTGYLSATRGDGGQNLIGPEIRENLGLIRTQELLAARKIDGGEQFFSRANDFGFSKNPDETLTIWNKEEVLADFVRVIRTFKPDVIITRFNTVAGTTHGHHTTSALLAKEAFDLAGDVTVFPDQLDQLEIWQPSKLFWNTSSWFYSNNNVKFDPKGLVSVDVGKYNRNFGISYTEMASKSRSMHKSQGFGSTGSRGEELEYLAIWRGDTTQNQVFGGIDTSWKRVKGSEIVAQNIANAEKAYDVDHPERSLSYLLKARNELLKMPSQFWKEVKLKELNETILAILGIYLEIVTDDFSYVRGETVKFSLEAISRLQYPIKLSNIVIEPWGEIFEINRMMQNNQKIITDYILKIPENKPFSSPYWLNDQGSLGMYYVWDKNQIGRPENDPSFNARFIIEVGGQFLEVSKPIYHKYNSQVDGEVYRPATIIPDVSIDFSSEHLIFADQRAKTIEVRVIAGKDDVTGMLHLDAPQGWMINPSSIPITISLKNEEHLYEIEILGAAYTEDGKMTASFELTDGRTFDQHVQIINYEHIPVQTIVKTARVDLIKLNLIKKGQLIGYIQGAGDIIPDNLRQIGYEVILLKKDDIMATNLAQFDAVIVGVRAFNTIPWLAYKNQELFDYSFNGGTVIVQYNTSGSLVTKELAPYPLLLSRDRVTDETAEVRIIDQNHRVMNFPNKITAKDFEGWTQERGLYFPSVWDEKFVPILSCQDPGESPKEGGLLIAQHGKGYYIYTGYSWFRELPAGVEGAYRIFANMISIGQKG